VDLSACVKIIDMLGQPLLSPVDSRPTFVLYVTGILASSVFGDVELHMPDSRHMIFTDQGLGMLVGQIVAAARHFGHHDEFQRWARHSEQETGQWLANNRTWAP